MHGISEEVKTMAVFLLLDVIAICFVLIIFRLTRNHQKHEKPEVEYEGSVYCRYCKRMTSREGERVCRSPHPRPVTVDRVTGYTVGGTHDYIKLSLVKDGNAEWDCKPLLTFEAKGMVACHRSIGPDK